MAFVWVQHYFPLPIVFEDIGMGDEFTQQGQSSSENFPGRRRGERPVVAAM